MGPSEMVVASGINPLDVASPLDLCQPPDGFKFSLGLWLAHDVDMAMVADTVAPLLAGTPDPDPQRRRRLAAAIPQGEAELFVLGCQSSLSRVVAFPWTTFIPVGGRVQHAKGGVLQFKKIDSVKMITRAFVTSANLTRGSLANREVLVWEETGSQKSTPTLALDILAAVKAMANDPSALSPRGQYGLARFAKVLSVLRAGLPKSQRARCTADSLATSKPLLAQIDGDRPSTADRLVIVSPPFAGDGDRKAASYLEPWVRTGTQVDIYTGVDAGPGDTLGPSRRPAFSKAVLSALAAASGAPVNVWGVPTYDANDRRRRLHAKLVAIVRADVATVIAGSANCTGRGLGGENRELMARQDWSGDDLDDWLAELEAIPFLGEVAAPEKREEPAEVPSMLVEVGAWFKPHAGQKVARGRYRGILGLSLPDNHRGLRLQYRDEMLSPKLEQDFELWELDASLTASVGKSKRLVPIEVFAGDDFWEGPDDNEDDEDPVLLALLRRLRPTHSVSQEKRTTAPTPTGENVKRPDDRYTIDPRQVLTLLARWRVGVRERFTEGLGSAAKDLFPDEIERRVADAILGHLPPATTPLTVALAEAVEEFEPPDE